MTNSEIAAIIELAKRYNSDKLLEKISIVYGKDFDLESKRFSNLSLLQLFGLSIRVMNQFINSFDDVAIVLPLNFSHPQYGTSTVLIKLENFITNVESDSLELDLAEVNLLWLTLYQIEFGFYNDKSAKYLDFLLENESKLNAKLELGEKSLLNQKNESDVLLKKLQTVNSEIEEFVVLKKEELRQISSNLSTSNDNSNYIAEILNKSVELNSKLDSLVGVQEENKNRIEKVIQELNANSKNVEEKIESFSKQVDANEEYLKTVESKKAFFDERIAYLNELIGREVGVSLFETFKQRKTELRKSVVFWTAAVPIMSFVTIAWIYFIFGNVSQQNYNAQIRWELFALNTLKTLPSILLLFFTINQYRNERNFQEEYAFKSAVALTIDAYAGRLTDLSNKDKLIMESVLNIYKTPIKNNMRKKKSIDIKMITELLKSANETSKNLKT